jgi:DNA-binding GntR family transcriptional regulator/DNA-binding XRE family transcriptional regulator
VQGRLRQIGENFRAARTAAGLTVAELAKKSGLTVRAVDRAEAGDSGLTVLDLLKLSRALGNQAGELFVSRAAKARKAGKAKTTESDATSFVARDGAELVSKLTKAIAAQIASGHYTQGDKLGQEALAREFKVSRTPVREALSQLAAYGLVLQTPQQGAVVRPITSKQIRDAYQVRAELEGLGALLAAEWITDRQFEELKDAEKKFARAVTAQPKGIAEQAAVNEAWVSSNELFHNIILDASNNRKLKESVARLHQGFTRPIMMMAAGMDKRRMRENVEQHTAIYECLRRRDGEAARNAMIHHIHRAGELAAIWIEERDRQKGRTS